MDRKAWIVVTLCGILLAASLYQSSQNAQALQEQRAAEDKKKASEQVIDITEGKPAELTVEKLPIPEELGTEESREISTRTNLFTLSSLEGGIVKTELFEEKAVIGETNVTMNDLGRNRIGALTRLSGESLEKGYYDLTEGEGGSVIFTGKTQNNLDVTKTWAPVTAGAGKDHRLTFTLKLTNPTDGEISLGDVAIFSGSAAPVHRDERSNYLNFFWNENGDFDHETNGYFNSFFGADATEFRQLLGAGVNFAGVENQFFAIIISPKEAYPATFRAVQKDVELPAARGNETANSFNTNLSLRDEAIPAGESRSYTFDIFMGPKNNALIRSLEGDKGDVMNYGSWFGWISRPLNWTLNALSNLFGGQGWSWGWAIVVLTLIIRTIMWPLHAKSTRTMKRMSKLQPKIKALKEKYPEDPNKMNQEMMKLYKQYGVNPMGGCLPMLFQIPVFFGFYNMLQYAVELRNQPFLGWVDDLSQPDTIDYVMGLPINILPILMAVTMVIQMQITPKTGDKMQQRIFMLMPLVFFFFCYNFASALALYWTTQNIFSIGQTWLMQKMPEPELKTSKNAGKKTWMQKMADRAEEAQKQRSGQKKGGKRPGQKQAKTKKPRGPKTGG
ncbi:MAG: YidC/Oxa1 family membrane protein insertase [Akkermansiaceae bacterium]|jgi:YidC/Oxa1 family membrane protein insertase